MILHITMNRNFVDYAVDLFEAVSPEQNEYILIENQKISKAIPIDNSERIQIIEYGSAEYTRQEEKMGQYEGVVVHSLHKYYFSLIDAIPKNVPLVWIMFGTEVYNSFKEKFIASMQPKTKKLYFKLSLPVQETLNCYYQYYIAKPKAEKRILSYANRIDFIALSQNETFEFLKECGFKASFLDFTFYSIQKTLSDELREALINGNNILIGNSASYTNNHLDIFELLEDLTIENREVIVPLSYGYKKVVNAVVRKGKEIWGDQFHPLLEYQERNDYNKTLLSCNVAIMNHLRPEARGNVFTSLWLGAKLYLNEDTIFYRQCISQGLIVESIQEKLNKDNPDALKPLKSEQVRTNREILKSIYGGDVVLQQCNDLIRAIKA